MNPLRHIKSYSLLCMIGYLLHTSPAYPQATPAVPASDVQAQAAERDGQHGFDFDIDTWKTHTSRLLHPLTNSNNWIEMDGITVVQKIWDGRANLAELESDGPTGHLELLALRLYNPQAHQWSLNFATSKVGVLNAPSGETLIGEYRDGNMIFYDQEPYNGKAIWVRFTIAPLTADTVHSEQAFSNDGGKTWETNFITKYTRVKDQ
jgi:hypothetical protein